MISQKIGVLGGGQLGRMLVEASIPLSLDISVLDESLEYPAASICTRFFEGSFTNYKDVMDFGLAMDVVTVEIESVNVEALKALQMQGIKVFPQPQVLEIINDKGLQKQFYSDHGFPTSEFLYFNDKEEILQGVNAGMIPFPFVQKLRKGGYDGRGVIIVENEHDLTSIFDAPSIVEKKVEIAKELAIIIARSAAGEIASFPMVEMSFQSKANLVEFLFCPAQVEDQIKVEAKKCAEHLVEKLGIVGLLAIEFFLTEDGRLLINEIAPRPHNSGHHTIEANVTSQFEQLLRAILGLPLGNTDLIMPSVMVNLLGEEGYSGPVIYEGIEKILAIEGVYPHLYNKKITRPNRKMGHITITNKNLGAAIEVAENIRKNIKVKSK